MRLINLIVVHCSATAQGRDFSAKDIGKWHRRKGWRKIGYHYVIRLDGTVESGRKAARVGAHVYGYNANSIGICYIGGIHRSGKGSRDTRTMAQKKALRNLLTTLRNVYPYAAIKGHRNLSPDVDGDGIVEKHEWLKDCPCFSVRADYGDI